MKSNSFGSKKTLNLKNLSSPKYCEGTKVSFLGGSGVIKNYISGQNIWGYIIEMKLGPEPIMGRLGPETTVFLYENDIYEYSDENLYI